MVIPASLPIDVPSFLRRWRWCPRQVGSIACGITLVLSDLLGGRGAAAQGLRLETTARTTSQRLTLGPPLDAVADSKGHVFILDQTGRRIVVTDDRLRPLGVFGRPGSKPGEFRDPVSIGMLPDGRLAVLDRAVRRVTVLAIRGGRGRTSLVLERTVTTGIPSESMCVLTGNKLLLYGSSAGTRLHVFDLDARLLRSFAPTDSKLSPLAQEVLAQGRIACDGLHDEVLVSSRVLPVVESFRISTGTRSWVDTLRPFRALGVTDNGGSVRVSGGRAGFSLVSSLFTIDDCRVFQTVYESRRDEVDIDTVVSYVHLRRKEAWMPPQFDVPILFLLSGRNALSVRKRDNTPEIQLNRLVVGECRRKDGVTADGSTNRRQNLVQGHGERGQ